MTASTDLNPFIEYPGRFIDRGDGDEQWAFTFGNGYTASVIKTRHSLGGTKGLWEVAVINMDGELDYSTPVTGDVEGWLSVPAVRRVLTQIGDLPPKDTT